MTKVAPYGGGTLQKPVFLSKAAHGCPFPGILGFRIRTTVLIEEAGACAPNPMANRPGKHSAPLNSGTSRRGAHSAPLGSTQGRRGSHSAPVTSAGRSTRSAQAARSRSAQADVSRTPRAARARSSFEGTGFAPTASPVSAAGGSQSFAATDSLARAKAARKKSRGKKIALGIAAALVVVLAGAGTALAL